MSLPALWAVRSAFPNAHIGLLSNADVKNPHYVSAEKVLPPDGLIDEWLTYPTNLGKAAALSSLVRLAIGLRRSQFDSVVYLMPRMRTIEQIDRDLRFFRFAGIRRSIGVNYLRKTGLKQPIPRPTPVVESESEHLLRCLTFDGIKIDVNALAPNLMLSDAEISAANNWFLNAAGGSYGDRRLVAVAPGSKWASKVWPEDRFEAVVGRMISTHGIYPIIFGGQEDSDKADRLIGKWKSGVNAAGKLTVRESAALLRECELYVGNDTGTMHLAAAVDTKCVAVFASIDWRGRWAPYGGGHTVFRHTVECEGCYSPDCFNAYKCLDLTGVDDVYEACVRALQPL